MGGATFDQGNSIVATATGGVLVGGTTFSDDYPTTPGAVQTTFGGGFSDGFVTEVSEDGTRFLSSTFWGGTGDDQVLGLARDALGLIYVTGRTGSMNFVTTADAFQPNYGGGPADAYYTIFDPTLTSAVHSSYFGGAGFDAATAMSLNPAGTKFVFTGLTSSPNLPTTPNAAQPTPTGIFNNAFVVQVDKTTFRPDYITYWGGGLADIGTSVKVDADNIIHLAGITSSTDFPTTPDAFQFIFGGGEDCWFTNLDTSAPGPAGVVFSTYYGGSGMDNCNAIALDRDGNTAFAGKTNSPDLPTTSGAGQNTLAGGDDIAAGVIAKGCTWRSGVCPAPCLVPECTQPFAQACLNVNCHFQIIPNPGGSCDVKCIP
jgi:hypothetical protein